MSSADEAFDSLMDKKALNIPVANPLENSEVEEDDYPDLHGEQDAIRVSALLDEEPEYNPPVDNENGIYVTPTETDLDPVDDEDGDPVTNARRQGARVAGRDATPEVEYVDDADEDEDDYRDAREVYDGDDAVGVSGLDRARRVRRFAYLPLAGGEAFESSARDMLTSLASRSPDRPSMAITSAGRGEGKTELAIRLALAMGKRVGARILLVDFDLRRPQVASRLGVSSKYFTLVDVLRGSCMVGEALTVSEEDNLYVLPARATDREGDEILDNREVSGLLGQLHGAFDFTIIDCGPVGRPDAMVVCSHAGFAALAGYCIKSSAVAMRAAGRKLTDAGIDVAGLVLTGV